MNAEKLSRYDAASLLTGPAPPCAGQLTDSPHVVLARQNRSAVATVVCPVHNSAEHTSS
jgi:hypothetical protein